MTARPIRVCLIMHSTRSDNLGVGALTLGEVVILRHIARDLGREIEITVVDWKDARTPYVTGQDIRVVDLNGRFLINPFGFFTTVRRADLVIDIGAGDSFADIYGAGRLKRMFAMKFLTHLAGTPLVVAPQTIGPFTKGWSKALARLSLQLSAVVATRDSLSTAALRDLGYKGKVIEASDVALKLPYDPPASRGEGPPRVGINISGLLMSGGYTGRNEFGIAVDYPGLMRELIHFFQSEGAEVHLVPHVLPADAERTHGEDDSAVNTLLAAEFSGLIIAPRFAAPSAAKSYIATLDFFMGARMHACIAAFSAGVPVVPIAYSRKFTGLFGSLGYDHTVDCTSGTNAAILEKIVWAFHNRTLLLSEIVTANAVGLRKLEHYSSAVEYLLKG